jgi:hypothetical protein
MAGERPLGNRHYWQDRPAERAVAVMPDDVARELVRRDPGGKPSGVDKVQRGDCAWRERPFHSAVCCSIDPGRLPDATRAATPGVVTNRHSVRVILTLFDRTAW